MPRKRKWKKPKEDNNNQEATDDNNNRGLTFRLQKNTLTGKYHLIDGKATKTVTSVTGLQRISGLAINQWKSTIQKTIQNEHYLIEQQHQPKWFIENVLDKVLLPTSVQLALQSHFKTKCIKCSKTDTLFSKDIIKHSADEGGLVEFHCKKELGGCGAKFKSG